MVPRDKNIWWFEEEEVEGLQNREGNEDLVDCLADPLEGLGPNFLFLTYGIYTVGDHIGKSFSLAPR